MYAVISSIKPDAVRELIATGMKNRSPFDQDDKGDLVEITEELKHSVVNLFSMKSKHQVLFNIT